MRPPLTNMIALVTILMKMILATVMMKFSTKLIIIQQFHL